MAQETIPGFVVLPVKADLVHTIESGQPPNFTWTREPGPGLVRYSRKLNGKDWVLAQLPGGRIASTKLFARQSLNLLRHSDNLAEIHTRILTDPVMGSAVKAFPNLRLTRSDEWETTITFLCSMNNNLKRIRGMVQKTIGPSGGVLPPGELEALDLRKLGFGYRAEYIRETSRLVAGGEFDLMGLSGLDYLDARDELQLLPGIGPKVADCILLYGFGKLDAFPQDVWIKRIMQEGYGVGTQKAVEEFARERWPGVAGYAQHYLFWYAKSSGDNVGSPSAKR